MPSAPDRPTLDPSIDAELVSHCLRGDRGAWNALVDRYERLVYGVARSYRLDDDDVADVFQEVFTALVRGLPRLRDPRSLCRWLSSTSDRIARATALPWSAWRWRACRNGAGSS
jgi:DNA-directed RNA polymerase specialized sigma24 family protein